MPPEANPQAVSAGNTAKAAGLAVRTNIEKTLTKGGKEPKATATAKMDAMTVDDWRRMTKPSTAQSGNPLKDQNEARKTTDWRQSTSNKGHLDEKTYIPASGVVYTVIDDTLAPSSDVRINRITPISVDDTNGKKSDSVPRFAIDMTIVEESQQSHRDDIPFTLGELQRARTSLRPSLTSLEGSNGGAVKRPVNTSPEALTASTGQHDVSARREDALSLMANDPAIHSIPGVVGDSPYRRTPSEPANRERWNDILGRLRTSEEPQKFLVFQLHKPTKDDIQGPHAHIDTRIKDRSADSGYTSGAPEKNEDESLLADAGNDAGHSKKLNPAATEFNSVKDKNSPSTAAADEMRAASQKILQRPTVFGIFEPPAITVTNNEQAVKSPVAQINPASLSYADLAAGGQRGVAITPPFSVGSSYSPVTGATLYGQMSPFVQVPSLVTIPSLEFASAASTRLPHIQPLPHVIASPTGSISNYQRVPAGQAVPVNGINHLTSLPTSIASVASLNSSPFSAFPMPAYPSVGPHSQMPATIMPNIQQPMNRVAPASVRVASAPFQNLHLPSHGPRATAPGLGHRGQPPPRPFFPVTEKPHGNDPVLQGQYEQYLEWRKANEPGYHQACKDRQERRAERQRSRGSA